MRRIGIAGGIFWVLCSQCFGLALDDKSSASKSCNGQITYQSDSDSAYAYLEAEQRKIYTQNPGLADPYSREEVNSPRTVKSFSDLKKLALKVCPDHAKRDQCALDPDVVDLLEKQIKCMPLPTRFESPIFSSLITLTAHELDEVRTAHFPDSMPTRFGSLPTGTFDAQAILPPGSQTPLVILNRDLFFVTGAFSKSISDALPISMGRYVKLEFSSEAIQSRLKSRPYIVRNFADAVSKLVLSGSSAGAQEVTLDETHNHLHARLLNAMDSFLISHEQAHVILKHVSDRSIAFRLAGSRAAASATSSSGVSVGPSAPVSSPNSALGSAVTTLTAELRTREQELQADALGFKLMMWVEKAGGDPISELVAAAAPHMVFRLLDAANVYGREAGGWTFADANHPLAEDRIQALAPVFDEMSTNDPLLRQVDFRIAFDAVFRALLTEADPIIRHNLGLSEKNR